IPITTYIENGFKLPGIEAFEKVKTPRTKAVLFSNPSNPTGTVYTREQLVDLCKFCYDNDLYIISDEAYYEITQRDKIITLLNLEGLDFDIRNHTIVIDSISKRFSACGARVGAIISKNNNFMKQVLKFCQARLCAPYYGQVMGEAALDFADEYLVELSQEYQKRIDATCEELSKNLKIKYHHSEGAFYIMVKLPIKDSDDFAVFLLKDFYSINPQTKEKETIMVAPARGFYKTHNLGSDEIRIACVLEAEKMRRSVQILNEGLDVYLSKK
ncbi:MAG TPA: aminotransferase class I/II-fold pyridoxal phosphate-dependent enzyme, partial [bacterium]|nr:aminotransferase class I/II-fold pyridoxal phosphate-dependent enzyme [bacterium]